jgi:deferrochelatase/peroxidase EfeB
MSERRGLDRRSFLRRSAGAAAAGSALVGAEVASPVGADAASSELVTASLDERIAFEGAHQAGILTPRQPQAVFVSLDAIADRVEDLGDALRTLSVRSRFLTAGGTPPPVLDGLTTDSGILGPSFPPDRLTVTIGLGASLFDGRYGLGGKQPRALKPMRTFPNDQLDPAFCHGDVLVQLCSGSIDTNVHALRDLMRATRGALTARWKIEAFVPPDRSQRGEPQTGRNLLGFKDGISNPDVGARDEMERLVWVGSEEPSWARGGSYAVVRIIRNRVEFWDRVSLREQELMIGRFKDTGGPLTGGGEDGKLDFAGDPDGEGIPLDAHIRLANPRDRKTDAERVLRRSYNYTRGLDEAGQLDQGLVFASYQRHIERQFEAIQERLIDEPLVDYVIPTGGGYFFLPPGARGADDWVGSGLFA